MVTGYTTAALWERFQNGDINDQDFVDALVREGCSLKVARQLFETLWHRAGGDPNKLTWTAGKS